MLLDLFFFNSQERLISAAVLERNLRWFFHNTSYSFPAPMSGLKCMLKRALNLVKIKIGRIFMIFKFRKHKDGVPTWFQE